MIYYYEEHNQPLKWFVAWSGGKSTLEKITKLGDEALQIVEDYINSIFDDHTPTETEINDFLWFEDDQIAEILGFKNTDEFWTSNTLKK